MNQDHARPDRTRAALLPALFALISALACSIASAQSGRTAVLADTPFYLDTVGLQVFLAEGSTTKSTRIGQTATVVVAAPDETWAMNIQTPKTSDPSHTVNDTADEIIRQIQQAAGEAVYQDESGRITRNAKRESMAQVVFRDPNLTINGQPADRFYLAVRKADRTSLIHGYTIFKPTANQFVIFELFTPESEIERVQPVYEVMVGTATFQDPTELNVGRLAAVDAGIRLFEGLNESDYTDLIERAPDRWERLYQPAPSGSDTDARELGYRNIRLREGRRADLDPGRDRQYWTMSDYEEGYVMEIDARYIQGEQVVDSSAAFFLRPDREVEAWVVRMTVRAQDGVQNWTELGARDGRSMNVQISQSGGVPENIRPLIQGDGYISRFEAYLLPQLLARAGIPTEFGFYTYQTETSTIRLRRDVLEQPVDRPGVWKLTTRLSEDALPMTTYMKSDGELLRVEFPDGKRWEPITKERLRSLWQRKGLPTN